MIFNLSEIAIIIALPQETQKFFEGIEIHYSGIGKKKAAQKTNEVILNHKPKHILNLGTAGSHKIAPHTLVEISAVVLRDAPGRDKISGRIEIPTLIASLPKGICGTGDSIELNPPDYYDLMDMEAYAIAKVCKRLNVGFTSIKYITDKSDTQTKKDWKATLPKAASSLFEFYKTHVKN